MGRQTAIEAATNAGASAKLPLDPGRLPAVFNSRAGGIAGSSNRPVPVEVCLDRETIIIKRQSTDEPVNAIIGVKAYSGVMVQVTPSAEAGSVCAQLILKHADDNLSVILAETGNPEELATIWPTWARTLSLPMLVCDLGGKVKPLEAYSARAAVRPAPRRRLPLLTGRRPRFLVRRKTGLPAAAETVHRGEREIIARH